MRLPPSPLLLLAALLGLSQCKKKDADPAKPEDQLPPATQTGAGTFGCLLNGQPWTPKGFNGYPNLLVTYDPTYHGGSLSITAYRYPTNAKQAQYIKFGGDQISKPGTYIIATTSNPSPPSTNGVLFADGNIASPCNMYQAGIGATQTAGQFTITRLDPTTRVVSGTFSFSLSQAGCTAIQLTEGRFDSQF